MSAILSCCSTTGTSAMAQDKERCAAAAEAGQKLRDDHNLLEARARFLVCASEVCPAVVRKDCANWQVDLDGRIPTVIFKARAGSRELEAVRVFMDGRRVEGRRGEPSRVEPGPHKVRFEIDGRPPVEQDVVIQERERSRPVTAIFEPDPAPHVGGEGHAAAAAAAVRTSESESESEPPSPRSGSRTAAFIVGGVGMLAAGTALYFGITGLQQTRDYHDGCAKNGNCSESDVDATRTRLLVADISGGVAAVALGVAVYLFLRTPSAPTHQGQVVGPRFTLSPIRGGGAAGIVTSF